MNEEELKPEGEKIRMREYNVPSWLINEQQSSQIQEIIRKYAVEFGLREGFEYRPNKLSVESPILIQEYFRLFLTQDEIIWSGILDPDGRYFKDERTLVDRIRQVVPGFASKQTGARR